MKVGVMQPYIFPYIGYWQLINAVDKFVILDDVHYIMRGYINRNSILLNGKPYRFTIPMKKASQNKLIMDTKLNFTGKDKEKFLATIRNAYKKAKYYESAMPLIEEIINNSEDDLTRFVLFSIKRIMEYLGVQTEVLVSSKIDKNQELKAEERIIEICKRLDADIYINSSGGRMLYSHSDFEKEGMKLFFLDVKGKSIIYNQGQTEFVSNLSIIDIIMNNDVNTIKKFLEEYELNE